MRILVCPDKFKGSLPAHLVARAMSDGIQDADPRYQVDAAPMADGGDGTVDAFLAAMGGKKQTVPVLDPLGREVESFLGLLPGGSVVLEMAAASGLAMVPEDVYKRQHDDPAIHIPGRPAHGLDQGGGTAEVSLLVGVQNGYQPHLGQVQTLPQQVDAHQHVKLAQPQIPDDLLPLHGLHIGVHIPVSYTHLVMR